MAEGRETGAGMDDAESDGTFHFVKLEELIKNQKVSAKIFSRHSYVALSDERRSAAPLSLAVMAGIASRLQILPPHKPAAARCARPRYGTMSILVHFLVGHTLHECFAVRVEGDRHSLGTTSASIFGYP